MKKFLVASLLALSMTVLSHQGASAGCYFNIGGSFNLTYASSGSSWSFCKQSNPMPCFGCPEGYGGMADYSYSGYPDYSMAQATPPQQARPDLAQVKPSQYQQAGYGNGGYQPVGYGYQGQGYGNYQVPGSDYSNSPAYWYGR